jgi:uncharacterized membrane protein YqiK
MTSGSSDLWVYVVVCFTTLLLVLVGCVVLVARLYRQVPQGKALILSGPNRAPRVSFTGTVVFPFINHAELIDVTVMSVDLERRGLGAIVCKDGVRADIRVRFLVRVNKTVEDVLKVAQSIGCARASDPQVLQELFTAKFSEALNRAARDFDFEEIGRVPEEFKDKVIEGIGRDLSGFVLDDVALDSVARSPR